MKVLINKKDEMFLIPCSRTDIKGKATTKIEYWRIEVANKEGERSTFCEVRNADFGVVCEILNIKDLAKMNEDSRNHGFLEHYGATLMEALLNAKSFIKITNKNSFYVINKNDDLLLKSKSFDNIIEDLQYRYKAQKLSMEENIGF